MAALYLDTEYNGFHGELISLTLASTCGHRWYPRQKGPPNRCPNAKCQAIYVEPE